MRALILQAALYPWRFAGWLGREWNAFWHTPADPVGLGMVRVTTGLMLLYSHAVWGLELEDFFGKYGWVDRALAESAPGVDYNYSFWWYVPDAWLWPVYAATMAVYAAFTAGLWTRASSILAFITLVSYVQRVPEALFGLDKLEIVLTFYLAVGASGGAVSVDAWRRRRKNGPKSTPAWTPSAGANLGQRLIQVHMCIIYLFAGLDKLRGISWWTGNALWLALANNEYRTIDMTWLAWHPWALNLLCHVSIALELSFCVLVWFPMWRPIILLGMVGLHVGIAATLGLWTFSLIMLVGCAAFLPNEGLRLAVDALARRLEPLRPAAGAAGRPRA